MENMTRIMILLAKATIMFLPVSLMTSYFSTELQGVKGVYTKVEYWISFAVIFSLTSLSLLIIGFPNDKSKSKSSHWSLVKTFFDSWWQTITQRKRSK